MTENKRYIDGEEECVEDQFLIDTETDEYFFINHGLDKIIKRLNEQEEEIKQLKKDVEYWKQVASQYSNELNVFEHCKKYKTECKDIYWSSDVDD